MSDECLWSESQSKCKIKTDAMLPLITMWECICSPSLYSFTYRETKGINRTCRLYIPLSFRHNGHSDHTMDHIPLFSHCWRNTHSPLMDHKRPVFPEIDSDHKSCQEPPLCRCRTPASSFSNLVKCWDRPKVARVQIDTFVQDPAGAEWIWVHSEKTSSPPGH